MSYMSHKEKYEEGVRRATIALKLFKKLQKDGFGGADFLGKIVLPFSSILKQGSPISRVFLLNVFFAPYLIAMSSCRSSVQYVFASVDKTGHSRATS